MIIEQKQLSQTILKKKVMTNRKKKCLDISKFDF